MAEIQNTQTGQTYDRYSDHGPLQDADPKLNGKFGVWDHEESTWHAVFDNFNDAHDLRMELNAD